MPPLDRRGLRIGAVLLAAGRSRRMGPRDKLRVEIDGRPIVRRAADAVIGAGATPRVAVVADDAVAAALRGFDRGFEIVRNPRPDEGMASSLRLGVAALQGRVDAALLMLGDLPWVRVQDVRAVMSAFDPKTDAACVPSLEGRRGHPVLIAARLFDEIAALQGDAGARAVLARHASRVRTVAVEHDGVLRDVDDEDGLR